MGEILLSLVLWAALVLIAVLVSWVWPRSNKRRLLTDAERAELWIDRKFQRVWYIPLEVLVEREVLSRQRVEDAWLQVARERRRIPHRGRRGERVIYYSFPPVINVRVRHDVALELGLDVRADVRAPLTVTADEPWIPGALLGPGAREAIRETATYAYVYANDEEVAIEVGAGASPAQLAWTCERAVALAHVLRDAKRRMPRTRPFVDLIAALQGLARRHGARFHDDTVRLEVPIAGLNLCAAVARDKYGCFKLSVTMPFAAPLPGEIHVTADHRDGFDKFFGKDDPTVGDASFDERFVLRGDMAIMRPLLTPEVRRVLVPLALASFVEIAPAGLMLEASGLSAEKTHRVIELTLEAARVVAARVDALTRPHAPSPNVEAPLTSL